MISVGRQQQPWRPRARDFASVPSVPQFASEDAARCGELRNWDISGLSNSPNREEAEGRERKVAWHLCSAHRAVGKCGELASASGLLGLAPIAILLCYANRRG